MKQGFKELQREWYAKLAASGFVDVEADVDKIHLRNHNFYDDDKSAGYAANNDSPLAKVDYYMAVSHAIQNAYGHLHARLVSDRQRVMMYVLDRHAEGISTREICSELKASGMVPCRRNTITNWIKQFVHSVGIRHYEEREMKDQWRNGKKLA